MNGFNRFRRTEVDRDFGTYDFKRWSQAAAQPSALNELLAGRGTQWRAKIRQLMREVNHAQL